MEEEIEENKKQKIEAENSVQEYTIQLGPLENELNERKFQLDSEASEVEKLNVNFSEFSLKILKNFTLPN